MVWVRPDLRFSQPLGSVDDLLRRLASESTHRLRHGPVMNVSPLYHKEWSGGVATPLVCLLMESETNRLTPSEKISKGNSPDKTVFLRTRTDRIFT